MIPTVSVLMVYLMVEAALAGTDLVYFAFVNYTTLGYGDVIPLERAAAWRDMKRSGD